jgi:cell wall-associated NlpC family hydrolase
MGYAIQVGAFSQLENAVRLERLLNSRGIDAYYFRHESGLYKVRFSNHTSYGAARAEAEQLRAKGFIEEFFIVIPDGYAVVRVPDEEQDALRAELVRTAHRFLGVPYRWGGTDHQDGFDCSGLTMVCYRLNGLNLPRVSRSQFAAGRLVPREELRPGDLVFFATRGGNQVSHVGLYIGGGQFIHAPRAGQEVRIEQLSKPFYSRTYRGARSYF